MMVMNLNIIVVCCRISNFILVITLFSGLWRIMYASRVCSEYSTQIYEIAKCGPNYEVNYFLFVYYFFTKIKLVHV